MNSTKPPQRRYLRRNACLRVFTQTDSELPATEPLGIDIDDLSDSSNLSLESSSARSDPGSDRLKWAASRGNFNALDDSQVSRDKSGVTFGTVSVRSHKNVLGDNPSCSKGLPVELEWDHCQSETFLVDVFEEMRSGVPKRVIRIHPRDRERILRLKGHSRGSFQNVLLEIDSIKQSREASQYEFETKRDSSKISGGSLNDHGTDGQLEHEEHHLDFNTHDMEEYMLMARSSRRRKGRGDRTAEARSQSKSPIRKAFHWK